MPQPVILCVDDERIVLDSLKTQLKKAFGDEFFYEVAESAHEALELIEELEEDNIEIAVIISDWLMPGMKGDAFLIHVHQNAPNIIKIMLTGQADEGAIGRAQQQAQLHDCLFKPWEGEVLIQTLKTALNLD
ncbi:MAG: response regulator [Pseudomonadota bacterium]|nr:response regulator [Pseudomonadota bacterium]